MPAVTSQELQQILLNLNRPSMASLQAIVVPEMVRKHRETKEPNPFWGQTQVCMSVNGVLGAWNYENSVNRQRIREAQAETIQEVNEVADFVALPRDWGVRLVGTALVEYNERFYVEVKVQSEKSIYFINGQEASDSQFESLRQFLRQRSNEGRRQELERIVRVRDFRLDHVVGINMNGQHYFVEN